MVEFIKIGTVFFIVLLLTFRKVTLWMALLLGTFLLGVLFRLPFQSIVKDVFTSIVAVQTLLLLGAFIAILFFSSLLKETGRMVEILEGFRSIFKDIRVVIALLPAMIGLMPIVGGGVGLGADGGGRIGRVRTFTRTKDFHQLLVSPRLAVFSAYLPGSHFGCDFSQDSGEIFGVDERPDHDDGHRQRHLFWVLGCLKIDEGEASIE